MNTTITPHVAVETGTSDAVRRSPMRRLFGVVAEPQSYRNVGYLLLGVALATAWSTLLVTALTVSLSMVVVALLGIPLLVGTWYAIRAFANVERAIANVLLGQHLRAAPMASGHRGNVWLRLVAMSRERGRWRELAYLVVRIPVGIATFAITVIAVAVPLALIWSPFHGRRVDDFGAWSGSSELHDVASSTWAWCLVPLGLGALVVSVHLLNALAGRCGRWCTAWLDTDRDRSRSDRAARTSRCPSIS